MTDKKPRKKVEVREGGSKVIKGNKPAPATNPKEKEKGNADQA